MNIYSLINKIQAKKNRNNLHKWGYRYDSRFLNALDLPKLTKDEVKEVQNTWPFFGIKEYDLLWHRVFKKLDRFSPYYVGSYQSVILWNLLNLRKSVGEASLNNKAFMPIFFPEISLPKTFFICHRGVFYSHEMTPISVEQCSEIVIEQGGAIVKESYESSYGMGVYLIKATDVETVSKELKSCLLKTNGNFVAQEILKQNEVCSSLNPTSINGIRMTSIFLNGKYGASSILKVGKKGSFIDNWRSGFLVPISDEGKILGPGFTNDLNTCDVSDTGVAFAGLQIPSFDILSQHIKEIHTKYLPMYGILGFDCIIDNNNKPRIIEINMRPEFLGEQLCAGPFFEPFRDDIIKIIKG